MPSFLTIQSERVENNSSSPDVGTTRQLTIPAFLCVSYEKEAEVYQPARIAGVVGGIAVMLGATKIEAGNGMLKAISTLAGLYMVGYNSARYMEVMEEMQRFEESRRNA